MSDREFSAAITSSFSKILFLFDVVYGRSHVTWDTFCEKKLAKQ